MYERQCTTKAILGCQRAWFLQQLFYVFPQLYRINLRSSAFFNANNLAGILHINHPVFGDPLYGGRMRYPAHASDELLDILQHFKRQALHASAQAAQSLVVFVREMVWMKCN